MRAMQYLADCRSQQAFFLPLTSLALSNCSGAMPTASPVSSRVSARLSLTQCRCFPFRPAAAERPGGVL
jgi:hypothetical protein